MLTGPRVLVHWWRQRASQGRVQMRPSTPGKTLSSWLMRCAASKSPWAIRRMYSGTLVLAGQAARQGTSRRSVFWSPAVSPRPATTESSSGLGAVA